MFITKIPHTWTPPIIFVRLTVVTSPNVRVGFESRISSCWFRKSETLLRTNATFSAAVSSMNRDPCPVWPDGEFTTLTFYLPTIEIFSFLRLMTFLHSFQALVHILNQQCDVITVKKRYCLFNKDVLSTFASEVNVISVLLSVKERNAFVRRCNPLVKREANIQILFCSQLISLISKSTLNPICLSVHSEEIHKWES